MTIERSLLMSHNGTPSKVTQLIGLVTPIGPTVFRWNYATGFGSSYGYPTSGAPITSPNTMAFSPSGNTVAFTGYGNYGGPCFRVWGFNKTTGWGTQYTLPSSTIGAGYNTKVKFTPDGNYLVVSGGTFGANCIEIYPFTEGVGIGPAISYLPNSVMTLCDFDISPDGSHLVIAGSGASNLQVYELVSGVITGPAKTPLNVPFGLYGLYSVIFADDYIATGNYSGFVPPTTTIFAMQWNGTDFVNVSGNTVYTSTNTSAKKIAQLSIPPSQKAIAAGLIASYDPVIGPLSAFGISAGSLTTQYTDPTGLLSLFTDGPIGVAFSTDGKSVAITSNTVGDPQIAVYAWNDSTGFGAKYTDISASLVSTVYGVAFW